MTERTEILDYNTERERLALPEYGRNVLKMVESLKEIPDREKRTEQAYAVIKVMELLNPQVRMQENYSQKLWDQLYMISGFDLDVDSPYPAPVQEDFSAKPIPVQMKGDRIKATHYGRNIEKIINLIVDQPEGPQKTELIRNLALYMRTQYLIWNKDSVSDETICNDIVKLSEGRIEIPEGLSLGELSQDASFSRPGMSVNVGQGGSAKNRMGKKKNNKNRRK